MPRARPYTALWTADPDEQNRLRSAVALAQFAVTSPDLTPKHRTRLLNEAIWYRTEGGGKYTIRFRSSGVLTLEATQPIKSWRKHLRHEHVVARAALVAEMRTHPDQIHDIVRKAVACIVTPLEHDQLKPFDASHYGWERYLAASIDVYDMTTGILVIEHGSYVNGGPADRPQPLPPVPTPDP
jgi:hypothetical protein